jgi:hypothetical protein
MFRRYHGAFGASHRPKPALAWQWKKRGRGKLYARGGDGEILMTIGPDAFRVAEARAIIGERPKIVRWEYRVRMRTAEP